MTTRLAKREVMRAFGYGRESSVPTEPTPDEQIKTCEDYFHGQQLAQCIPRTATYEGTFIESEMDGKESFFYRPVAHRMCQLLLPGDLVICTNFFRICTNEKEICEVVASLDSIGAAIVIVNQPIIDTTLPGVASLLAEIGRCAEKYTELNRGSSFQFKQSVSAVKTQIAKEMIHLSEQGFSDKEIADKLNHSYRMLNLNTYKVIQWKNSISKNGYLLSCGSHKVQSRFVNKNKTYCP